MRRGVFDKCIELMKPHYNFKAGAIEGLWEEYKDTADTLFIEMTKQIARTVKNTPKPADFWRIRKEILQERGSFTENDYIASCDICGDVGCVSYFMKDRRDRPYLFSARCICAWGKRKWGTWMKTWQELRLRRDEIMRQGEEYCVRSVRKSPEDFIANMRLAPKEVSGRKE